MRSRATRRPDMAAGKPSGRPPDGDTPAEPSPEEHVPDAAVDTAAQPSETPADEIPPPAGPVTNTVVAAVVIALGAATAAGAAALGLGTPGDPGPGTWPLAIGLVLVALGAVLVGTARRTSDTERFGRFSWDVLVGVVTMVVFGGAIGYIGFEIPATLLTLVWLRVLGREGWRLSLLTSVAVVAAFYLVFVVALSVDIPHLF